MPIYNLDLQKLYESLDVKRRQNRLSWQRLGLRIGTHPSTLCYMVSKKKPRAGINSSVLVKVIMYLNKPLTDFVIEEKPTEEV